MIVAFSMASSGFCDPGRHGATCRIIFGPYTTWWSVDHKEPAPIDGNVTRPTTSRIYALVDVNGLPVRLALSPGEAHDVRLAGKLQSRLKSGSMLLADRGYDADWIRELAMKKGAWANIPPKSNRNDPICFSPYLYPARNQVERFFNRIGRSRLWCLVRRSSLTSARLGHW